MTNSVGVSAYWSPSESGWIPSISTGWGLNSTTMDDNIVYDSASSQSWYVGLQWSDVFIKGNTLGGAVGQPTFVTAIDYDSDYDGSDYVGDGNYAFELWYMFQVTDNISVTPALFYLSRPLGQKTFDLDGDREDTFTNFGGLVKTTFRF